MEKYVKVVETDLSFPKKEGIKNVKKYDRWSIAFDKETAIEKIVFTKPDNSKEEAYSFVHQPARLCYDRHGYETVESIGDEILCVRYTPDIPGEYTYEAIKGGSSVQKGSFTCTDSDNCGFMKVGTKDSRYFETSDGKSFCIIGLNTVALPYFSLPKGNEHFATSNYKATMGADEFKRWFKRLSENGGNFVRIWVSTEYLYVEKEIYGELDYAAFAKLDAVVEYARQYGIKLKFCMEHFRTMNPGTFFYKKIVHPDGSAPKDMDEWYTQDKWQSIWLSKIKAYMGRYSGDPTVAVWELWNEINAVNFSSWSIPRDWTKRTIGILKKMAPKQLVVNSLGSYDSKWAYEHYEDFKGDFMEFQQVHRYLDQGAPYEICHEDAVKFSIDAINISRVKNKPVILAETGGVNDCHTGPFRYYRWDDRGVIFHDTTYPAFFAGAAGNGQIWHWHEYVDNKNLWKYLKPMSDLVKDVDFGNENFEAVELSSDELYFLALKGNNTFLGWLRNKEDNWKNLYLLEKMPKIIENAEFNIGYRDINNFICFPCWEDETAKLNIQNGMLSIKNLKYGTMFKFNFKTQV